MSNHRKYSISKLKSFAQSKTPIEVELTLDKTTVDFLLGLSDQHRIDKANAVEAIRRSIEKNGWLNGPPMEVSNDPELINGRLRLLALKEAQYPKNVGTRVIFGVKTIKVRKPVCV